MSRHAAIDASASPEPLSRVLGRGGSSSRMRRRTSEKAASSSLYRTQRCRAGQKLIEQDAQGVDIAAGVDLGSEVARSACSGLMYSGVPTRAPKLSEQRPLR